MGIKVPSQSSLDVLWLGHESLNEWDNLADPDALIQEIVEGLEAALQRFCKISSA